MLESQYTIVRDNCWHLYDDQFIETCAPWVIPYIGELIGYDPSTRRRSDSPDSRAEVANTIGYRRRKGTLVAIEQVTDDVSEPHDHGVVEEFKRLDHHAQPARRAAPAPRSHREFAPRERLGRPARPFSRL